MRHLVPAKCRAKTKIPPGINFKNCRFLGEAKRSAKRRRKLHAARLSRDLRQNCSFPPCFAAFCQFHAKPPQLRFLSRFRPRIFIFCWRKKGPHIETFFALSHMRANQKYTGWTRAEAHPPSNLFYCVDNSYISQRKA